MKKLIIAGSSKLQERAAYWRGYFEGRGYEIIDYPSAVSSEGDYAENLTDIYTSFFQNLERADVFFLMNEDYKNIGGYIGPSAFSELTYAIIENLNHGKKIEINLLQMPSEEQACYEEVKFWLDQKWISIYDRPTGKKATIPVPDTTETISDVAESLEDKDNSASLPEISTPNVSTITPIRHPKLFAPKRSSEKCINIKTCKKRCLHTLSPAVREYLSILSPEFPAWLLRYIATPDMQRLNGVSMACGLDYTGITSFENFHSVFNHSIGAALLAWRFTHDKKATLSALFHDIAAPAFKHSIDVMNGDAEKQESIEERTGEIIRNSRSICRQLKKDEILPGEVSDCKIYPIIDSEIPELAIDRLEYTFSNGYFLYDTWTLDQIRRFSNNITILHNEHDIEELGFRDLEVAKEFTDSSFALFANYHNDRARANDQFIADIIKSMELRGYLTMDDLYIMSEREVIDWILSCGDKTLSEAFRNFQRATSVYSSTTQKKDRYCTSTKLKVRYVNPLVAGTDESGDKRITELSNSTARALKHYLNAKTSKYTGFDFEFTPYSE